jgi:hypothetical protein
VSTNAAPSSLLPNLPGLPEVVTCFRPFVRRALAVLGVFLLFTVKVNLVDVAGETAGLRLDDLLLLALAAVFAAGWLVRWRTRLASIEVCFLLMLAAFLLSNIWNLEVNHQSSLLYTVRLVEYFLFFYLGIYYAQFYRLTPLVIAWLAVNGVLMVLQVLDVVGAFTADGYSPTAARAMGITGGAWEVGAIINFCFAILVAEHKYSTRRVLVLFAVTFALLLLTGARMPTVAHIVLLLIYFARNSRNSFTFLLKVVGPVAIVLGIVFLVPNPIAERSAHLLSFNNLQVFIDQYNRIPAPNQFTEIQGLPGSAVSQIDFSWMVRLVKWVYYIKVWLTKPVAWLIGLGPGFVGIALDGGWLRLVLEEGLLGTVCFLALFRALGKLHVAMRDITVALFISMLMIDIHIAYKAMSFVFFVAGCYYQRKQTLERAQLAPAA